eukprot:4498250-Pyramimonas_sp.AAC.1
MRSVAISTRSVEIRRERARMRRVPRLQHRALRQERLGEQSGRATCNALKRSEAHALARLRPIGPS